MEEHHVLPWFIAFLWFSEFVNFMRIALQPFNLFPAVQSYCRSERIVSEPNIYASQLAATLPGYDYLQLQQRPPPKLAYFVMLLEFIGCYRGHKQNNPPTSLRLGGSTLCNFYTSSKKNEGLLN